MRFADGFVKWVVSSYFDEVMLDSLDSGGISDSPTEGF